MKIFGADFQGAMLIERVPTLPVWNPIYVGRLVYVIDENTFYFGSNSEWTEGGSGSGTGIGGLISNNISSSPASITADLCTSYIHYVNFEGITTLNIADVSTVLDNSYFVTYITTNYVLNVAPYSLDRIRLNGVSLSDGNKITSDGRAGNYVTLQKDSNNGWTVVGRSGYWFDGGL